VSLFWEGLWRVIFLLMIICFILNFSFFTLNACIKKTRSSTISLILYLTFWICCFIIIIQIIQLDNYGNPYMPMPTSSTYIFSVGGISLITSYIIVLVQMIKHFIKKK